jgi:hypothetical protein
MRKRRNLFAQAQYLFADHGNGLQVGTKHTFLSAIIVPPYYKVKYKQNQSNSPNNITTINLRVS